MLIDVGLVTLVLTQPHGLSDAQDAGISEGMLYDEGLKVWAFALGHLRDTGKLPDVQTAMNRCQVDLTETPPEPLSYYVDRIVQRAVRNRVRAGMKKVAEASVQDDMAVALSEMKAAVADAEALKERRERSVVNLADADAINIRLGEYTKLKALGGAFDGLPFPWDPLNEVTRGIHDDELWAIIAAKKTGKSFWCILLALHIWWACKRPVLFVSKEMTIRKIARRWDAMWAKLPYEDFLSGQLSSQTERAWKEKLRDLVAAGLPPFHAVAAKRVRTVTDLVTMAKTLDPAIVIVDAAYFLRTVGDEKLRSDVERNMRLAGELQDFPHQARKPLVVSWQFNRELKSDEDMSGDLSKYVGFAYALVQNADGAIGLFRDDKLADANQMHMRLIEGREAKRSPAWKLNWDLRTMNFDVIGDVVPNQPQDQQQQGSAPPQGRRAKWKGGKGGGGRPKINAQGAAAPGAPTDAQVEY